MSKRFWHKPKRSTNRITAGVPECGGRDARSIVCSFPCGADCIDMAGLMPTSASILEKIRSSPRIPAPSQTVVRVLELTTDPDCEITSVAAVLSHDGGLTGELLCQANSALYGCNTPTSCVTEACVRLGMRRVRAAVINQHIVNGLGRSKPPGFDARRYWQSAFAVSVAAKDLCRELMPRAIEDAGTAGLLCDIGIGLLAFGVPDLYEGVLNQKSRDASRPLHEIEQQTLGLTHAEVSAGVLEDWKLDEDIVLAVRCHHADGRSAVGETSSKLSRIVAAAVVLSAIALDGSDMDRVASLFEKMDGLCDDSDALVERLLDGLVSHIQETAESLSVELGSVDQMRGNFDDCIKQLPDVSAHLSCRPMSRNEFGG